MAVEALLDPSPRSEAARIHVESLIPAIEQTESLTSNEKKSLLGSLKWLRCESINQAGRRLATDRLGARRSMDKDAPALFSYCYRIGSRLVHGQNPLPSQEEVGSRVAQLEGFVSDLLSGRLGEIELV
jgi:hypothetical protein